jgi:uncharacterized membrane protein
MALFWRPFRSDEEKHLVEAVAAVEKTTAAEIRIHVDRYCKGDPMLKAVNIFSHLKMEQTENRNGVLIFVAIDDRKFALYGDEGINKKVPKGFWESTRDKMLDEFQQGRMVEGISKGVLEAGKQLAKHFPQKPEDTDELSNEISYG